MNSKIEKAVDKQRFDPLRKMADGRDEALQLEAIEAMGKVPGEDSFNYLTGALRNPDAKIRTAAASGLGELKNPKSRAFLDHSMQQETDEAVREAMRGALAHVREAH